MVELLVVSALLLAAAAVCAALADGPPDSRRAARAVERYGRACDRVATAGGHRDLERLVRRHGLRLAGMDLAARGLARIEGLLTGAAPARR